MIHVKTYLIKEHVGLMKLHDTYDIFDAKSGEQLGVAKEEIPGYATFLRLLVSKKLIPTTVVIRDMQGDEVFRIHRPLSFFRAHVDIQTANGKKIGYFKSKILTIGGGFYVYDTNDQQFAEVKGDWKGWNFKFVSADGQEMGTVAKKWAGLTKELFTSADNYVIALNDAFEPGPEANTLLLAAGLAIDIIYKERDA